MFFGNTRNQTRAWQYESRMCCVSQEDGVPSTRSVITVRLNLRGEENQCPTPVLQNGLSQQSSPECSVHPGIGKWAQARGTPCSWMSVSSKKATSGLRVTWAKHKVDLGSCSATLPSSGCCWVLQGSLERCSSFSEFLRLVLPKPLCSYSCLQY